MGGSLILQINPTIETKDLLNKILQDSRFPNSSVHALQGESQFCSQELSIASQLSLACDSFFNFPEKALVSDGVFHEFNILKGTSKEDLRSKVEELASSTKARGLSENVISIFEELYMNAIYDGPAEFKKRFSIEENLKDKRIRISLGISDTRFVIACRDEYGSLDPLSYLRRVHEVYEKGVGQSIRFESHAGAGIGSYIVLENCQSLYFGVIPQKCTVVATVLDIQLSRKQREVVPKSIHYIKN